NNLINYLEKGESISLPEDPQDPLVMAENITLPQSLTLSVPFTAQAPNGDWNMPYQEACEEAAMIMVEYYLRNTYLDAGTANWEILNLIDYENANGYKVDVDTSETATIVGNYYYRRSSPYYGDVVTVENIKRLLASGYPVIIPAAGRILANPGYTGLGPEYHMLVIIGYDENGFITHDPGISSGDFYHYSYSVIENAIHDFTGEKATIQSGRKAMIVFY
ncbi:MAG: C39 family peptidase, partial [Candidatus Peregrinibacteria bacterium]